mmetsp:Transcript_111491/g.279203  ORF Transcript_111491/g.279203 Transcript_111491/m.279203 type:complete len:206 (-) Transcript_111491:14-631(-)
MMSSTMASRIAVAVVLVAVALGLHGCLWGEEEVYTCEYKNTLLTRKYTFRCSGGKGTMQAEITSIGGFSTKTGQNQVVPGEVNCKEFIESVKATLCEGKSDHKYKLQFQFGSQSASSSSSNSSSLAMRTASVSGILETPTAYVTQTGARGSNALATGSEVAPSSGTVGSLARRVASAAAARVPHTASFAHAAEIAAHIPGDGSSK